MKKNLVLRGFALCSLLLFPLFCAWAVVPIADKDAQRAPLTQKGNDGRVDVRGNVVADEDGLPVMGATVTATATGQKAVTDGDGNFFLPSIPQGSELRVTYVGMHPLSVKAKASLTIRLKSDAKMLDEFVVTGMFNRKKEGFTGSAVTIKGEDIKRYSTTNIAKALSAIAPGLRIAENIVNGSNPNGLPDMRMRGGANMDLGSSAGSKLLAVQGEYETYANQPLLIMDGFEISVQALADLDPDRVASIVMLKDAAATAIYGSRAANGVIVIETKTPKPGRIWVTYGGELRIENPDLTGYNLMNAREKLEAELISGLYTQGGPTVDKWRLYQSKLRQVLSGVDTYWLDKPLQRGWRRGFALSFVRGLQPFAGRDEGQ